MRRTVFLILGVLEFMVALVLVAFGFQLPGPAEVDRSFHRIQQVTDRTGDQVHSLHRQVRVLRLPELQQRARLLEAQTNTVTRSLRTQTVDYDTVRTMSEALGEMAKGLDGLAEVLDPAGIGHLGKGLGETASYLDEHVAPTAARTADDLERSTALLRADALRLKELLRTGPLDLKTAREVHDCLVRCSEGLDTMQAAVRVQRLQTMRDGFRGLDTALTSGAEQVERLAGYTYPVVKFNGGIKPSVEQKQFWPEGDKIAEGMRKAAAGATAAGKEMDALAADLPKIRASLDESRKVADKTREALATALKQQEKIEPLLKDVPEHAARLAEELPKLGSDLARILRDTARLKEVAASLRQAQKGIDVAVARWPELRSSLSRSAVLLRATQKQLKEAYDRRSEYEAATQQTILLVESLSATLPLVTTQMEGELRQQENALEDLGSSIDEVGTALPAYAQTTSRLLLTARLLVWLVATIVGLHAAYLLLTVRLGRQYSV